MKKLLLIAIASLFLSSTFANLTNTQIYENLGQIKNSEMVTLMNYLTSEFGQSTLLEESIDLDTQVEISNLKYENKSYKVIVVTSGDGDFDHGPVVDLTNNTIVGTYFDGEIQINGQYIKL